MEHTISGVGVIDKSMAVLNVVAGGKRTLGELVERTGLSRATCHRLAVALESHGLLRRTADGRFALGLHLMALPAMERLRATTEESVQLYVVDGGERVCVAALESPHGLRTIVPVGAALPLGVGSAGRVLRGELGPSGWVESVEERERGVASVSAPVLGDDGQVLAAISVSGPVDRTGPSPGRRHGAAVVRAARSAGIRP
jgi:DNA-binding IclR family transcriptional regulator